MKNLVRENELKIEKFDINYYLDTKGYQIAAALSALETTNELQQSYIKNNKEGLEASDYVLNLYALLQGLFVSIDSLYALSLALTKSKNYININNNKDLRQLKYIRNDVVGHPANRVLNNDVSAYCILDSKSINSKTFSYNIYTVSGVSSKTVLIEDLLRSYYKESNRLLDELYKISIEGIKADQLSILISRTLDIYYHDGDYVSYYKKFVEEYKNKYKNSYHRILWRCELIDELLKYESKNQDESDLIYYCVGLQLNKIYELATNKKYKVDMLKKTPKYLSTFFRFLKKNSGLDVYLNYIKDIDHPMFLSSLIEIENTIKEKNIKDAYSYITLIHEVYNSGNYNLCNALKMAIKEYKKK